MREFFESGSRSSENDSASTCSNSSRPSGRRRMTVQSSIRIAWGAPQGGGADGRRSHKPIGAGAIPFMPLRGFPDRSLDFVARQNAGELWLGFGVPLIENLSQAGEVEQQRLLSRGFGCEFGIEP